MLSTIHSRNAPKPFLLIYFLVLMTYRSLSHGHAAVRDVCIIGAGASGMYAALKLTDRNYTVLVLEKSDHLGGHSTTYRPAGFNETSELGVRIFPDQERVRETFGRFDLELKRLKIKSLERAEATGQPF